MEREKNGGNIYKTRIKGQTRSYNVRYFLHVKWIEQLTVESVGRTLHWSVMDNLLSHLTCNLDNIDNIRCLVFSVVEIQEIYLLLAYVIYWVHTHYFNLYCI